MKFAVWVGGPQLAAVAQCVVSIGTVSQDGTPQNTHTHTHTTYSLFTPEGAALAVLQTASCSTQPDKNVQGALPWGSQCAPKWSSHSSQCRTTAVPAPQAANADATHRMIYKQAQAGHSQPVARAGHAGLPSAVQSLKLTEQLTVLNCNSQHKHTLHPCSAAMHRRRNRHPQQHHEHTKLTTYTHTHMLRPCCAGLSLCFTCCTPPAAPSAP